MRMKNWIQQFSTSGLNYIKKSTAILSTIPKYSNNNNNNNNN